MPRTAPVAWITAERQVNVLDLDGIDRSQTSTSTPLLYGAWQVGKQVEAAYSWPTWSPDGRQLACFRLPGHATTARVEVFAVNGVEHAEVADLDTRLPIYLHWSPDGKWLAALTQRATSSEADHLHLSVMDPNRIGHERALVDGAPLFFTWTAANRIAAYVGSTQAGSQLRVLDPAGRAPTVVLPGSPSNFCAPIAVSAGDRGDRLMYVVHHKARSLVVTAAEEDPEPTKVEEVDGLVALVRSPDGRTVARAVAPDGDGHPYRSLALLDVASGRTRAVADLRCLAFLWSATGDALIAAQVDTRRNLVVWYRVGLDGTTEPFAELFPTRDFAFYLRFFEQYTQSHPLVDPTGRRVLLSGRLPSHSTEDAPCVWEVPIDGGGATPVGEGVFGVYGPAWA